MEEISAYHHLKVTRIVKKPALQDAGKPLLRFQFILISQIEIVVQTWEHYAISLLDVTNKTCRKEASFLWALHIYGFIHFRSHTHTHRFIADSRCNRTIFWMIIWKQWKAYQILYLLPLFLYFSTVSGPLHI